MLQRIQPKNFRPENAMSHVHPTQFFRLQGDLMTRSRVFVLESRTGKERKMSRADPVPIFSFRYMGILKLPIIYFAIVLSAFYPLPELSAMVYPPALLTDITLRSVTFFKTKTALKTMRAVSKVRLGIVIICICLLAVPAMAAGAYTTIPQGGTVYIGEQGLDVTAAMGSDSSIGWWASGAAIATSSPDSQMPITSPSNFYVSSSAFGQYIGTWYRLNAQGKPDGIAFNVADPSLAIRVIDTTVSIDVTNKWIPRGDQAAFIIDSNLAPIFSRGSSTTEGITLYVQSPTGGTYSALLDSSGAAHQLGNIVINNPSYQPLWTWDTGNSQYITGTYTVWAECDVNSMYDNYGIPGKTISQKTSLLDQEQNPLISVNVPTTVTTTQGNTVQIPLSLSPTPQSTAVPTTIPTITPGTPVPVITTPSATVSSVATISLPVETTTARSPGFGALLTLVSIGSLAIIALKNQH